MGEQSQGGSAKPLICITMGDPAGVGAEIAVKVLAREDVDERCVPVVVGDRLPLAQANDFSGAGLRLNRVAEAKDVKGERGVLDYIDLGLLPPGSFAYKKVQKLCGEASFQYVVKGISLAMEGKVHAVVTGESTRRR
jgi:4-hydroxythreonine-4-phosphate dehydrogenase